MGAFAYQAIDDAGKRTSGVIEAPDQTTAHKNLRQRNLTVTKISATTSRARGESRMPSFGNKIKSSDLTVFSRQFATMVSAGLTILRSMIILESQVQNPALRKVIREISSDIESGRPLSDALVRHPDVFDKLYVSMIRAGEIGGVLEMTLERVATSLEARESLRRKVKSAMSYPTVVLVFALLAAWGMIVWLVPIFAAMYRDIANAKLPAMTQFLMDLSSMFRNRPYVPAVAVLGPVFGFRYWKRTPGGGRQWDRIVLRIPMKIGMIAQKVALARFARTFSSLVASGVPMMSAIEVTGESAGNTVIEEAMVDVLKSIEEGRSFSEPLRRHPIFPPMVVQMAAIGEETGKLDAMMEKVAEFYEDEVDAMIKSLTAILEPIMMIFVGGIVGFIVLSLYMPMFGIFDKIR